MFAFPEMIAPMAEQVGIKVPNELDNYDPNEYVAWHVFSTIQLGASVPYHSAPWDNAAIISAISEEELKVMLWENFELAGIRVGYPIP